MDNLAYKYDNSNYEVIDGQVYMMFRPNMSHQRIAKNITEMFDRYLDGKTCEAIIEQDVFLTDDINIIPDVMIVCNPDIIEDDGIHGVPDLIVEILSKSTARRDKSTKFFLYEKFGVREYWIVDPLNKSVEVYINNDGKFTLDNVYFTEFKDYELRDLTEEELAEMKTEIKLSLYDDFIVQVKDIFKRVK